jgi:tRNA pseudouridine55 synthase
MTPKIKIILIDKPLGWTSFYVVNKIRWKIKHFFKKVKIGHTGTLDPQATGILIICIGIATKKINLFQDKEKIYTGMMKLGATTPSLDTETSEMMTTKHITSEKIQKNQKKFIGDIYQIPPIFSALKKNGEKLYNIARKGKFVKILPRKVKIHNFEITDVNLPFLKFRICCGKGVYIRKLAKDFGRSLNSEGYLCSLRRERIGEFSVYDAYKLEEFYQDKNLPFLLEKSPSI